MNLRLFAIWLVAMKFMCHDKYVGTAISFRAGLKGRQGRQLPRAPGLRGPPKTRAPVLKLQIQYITLGISYLYNSLLEVRIIDKYESHDIL